ncbi:MAG: hypothetical protein ACRD2G_11825 [Terriglobia bacterium]
MTIPRGSISTTVMGGGTTATAIGGATSAATAGGAPMDRTGGEAVPDGETSEAVKHSAEMITTTCGTAGIFTVAQAFVAEIASAAPMGPVVSTVALISMATADSAVAIRSSVAEIMPSAGTAGPTEMADFMAEEAEAMGITDTEDTGNSHA